MRFGIAILSLTLILSCKPAAVGPRDFSSAQFKQLLITLSDGWNEGNSQKAANCFTEDAIYTEPPDKQVYKGRQELFEFFGGSKGRPGVMTMKWHHIVFDEEAQIGAAEFTFTYGSSVHGVTMIRIRDGKISNWREYWYESPLDWNTFMGPNRF